MISSRFSRNLRYLLDGANNWLSESSHARKSASVSSHSQTAKRVNRWRMNPKSWLFEVFRGLSFFAAAVWCCRCCRRSVLMDVIHRHDSWIPFSLSSLRLSVSQHFYSNKCSRDWRTASARYYVSADKSAETKGTLGTDEWKVRYFQERREWRALLLTSLYLSHYIQQKDGRLPHANHTHTHTHTRLVYWGTTFKMQLMVFDLLSFDDGQYNGVIAAWLCANPPANTHKNNDQKQSENH